VDAVIDGLQLVLHWPTPGYLALGVLIGIYFGAVPGLGGLVGMAILLPFTFGMEPASAFAFLLGMYAVTCTSDTLACVLLGVPGTASSQATVLDGYPMAQKGEASRAFGAAFTWSAIGGVVGAIVLGLSIPIVRPLILSFSAPEFLMLGVLALTMVGGLSGNSLLKGCAGATLGLLLATVGYATAGTVPRFWFEQPYLLEGIPLIPLVLGLFGLPELLSLATSNSAISRVAKSESETGIMTGVRDAFIHWWLGLRCAAIGVYIGMLPGVGGSVVDWVAYGHAVQSTKDKENYGKGDVRGVIAPEAANNAMRGGALIPTIAFAIPGSASMAILLGAFTIHGLEPGPTLLTTRLDITFGLVWTLVFANILAAGLLLLWGTQIAKATFVPGHLILPAVVLFVFMGGWISGNNLGDLITLVVFGVLGTVMRNAGWPRPPVALGLILGPIMENAFHLSVRIHQYTWLTRPIVLVLMALIVATVVLAAMRTLKQRAEPGKGPVAEDGGGKQDLRLSIPYGALLTFVFAGAIVMAMQWDHIVRYFPLVIAVPGLLLAAGALGVDLRHGLRLRVARGAGTAPAKGTQLAEAGPAIRFLLWIAGIVAATLLIGLMPALLGFVALYLLRWGRTSWRFAAIYTAAAWAFLYVMFTLIVPVVWHRGLLMEWLGI